LRCTDAQHRAFLPTILAAAREHRVRVKVDCSYTPMLAHHAPDRALLAELAVYGCSGGDFLVGAKADGRLSACSFAPALVPTARQSESGALHSRSTRPLITELASYWTAPDAFGAFRTWRTAAEPCASCRYHDLCRGGCKVVSAHVTGELSAPDPECPRVIDHAARRPTPVRLPVL
jgi:radical SAM protein with 4Fe4S-binding SPASM domain